LILAANEDQKFEPQQNQIKFWILQNLKEQLFRSQQKILLQTTTICND